MRQYIKDHVYLLTVLISIIGGCAIVRYLIFERGYGLKDFVEICTYPVLGIVATIVVAIFSLLTFLIKEANQRPKLQYLLKGTMVLIPIIITCLFFIVYPKLEQPNIACKQQVDNQVKRLYSEFENNIKSSLPGMISQAAGNDLLNTSSILNQINKKQQTTADSFLYVTDGTMDAPCRSYVHEKVDSLLKDNKIRMPQNVDELISFTKDLQILVGGQNENDIDDFLNKHHVRPDAVLYEYWQNLNDPPREHLNFREFLLGLITNGVATRIISAVVQLDEENNLISEVYIITR